MKFDNHKMTDDEIAYTRALSRLPWEARFHKTLDNPTAPLKRTRLPPTRWCR
jgi:hypothetical protein